MLLKSIGHRSLPVWAIICALSDDHPFAQSLDGPSPLCTSQATRDVAGLAARVGGGLALGAIFGAIFWQIGNQPAADIEKAASTRMSLAVNVCMNAVSAGGRSMR